MALMARGVILLRLRLLRCLPFFRLLGGAFLFGGCGKRLFAVPRKGGEPPASLLRLLAGRQTRLGSTPFPGGPRAMRCMPSTSEARWMALTAGGVILFLLLRCLCFLLLGGAFLVRNGGKRLCGAPR